MDVEGLHVIGYFCRILPKFPTEKAPDDKQARIGGDAGNKK